MKKFLRFTSLVTLAAFLGLSAVETFHHHTAHQTEANCVVCQIAHHTHALIGKAPMLASHVGNARLLAAAAQQSYVQFVFVSHGLSPPIL
jgi:hypothetical protein